MLTKQILDERCDPAVYAGSYAAPEAAVGYDDCELLYIVSGSAEVTADGINCFAGQGDAFFFQAGVNRRICLSSGSALFIRFDGGLGRQIFKNSLLCTPLLSGRYDIAGLHGELSAELSVRSPYYETVVSGRIVRLLIEMLRREKLRTEQVREEPALSGLLREIDDKYEYYTFEEAAEYMHLSPAYFSTLFHREMGMTFSQYLNCVRVEKAVAMLKKTGVKITDVAMSCGFNTIRNFNRVFRMCTGYTPKQLPKDYRYVSGYLPAVGYAKAAAAAAE